jgi:hypothetical protein
VWGCDFVICCLYFCFEKKNEIKKKKLMRKIETEKKKKIEKKIERKKKKYCVLNSISLFRVSESSE